MWIVRPLLLIALGLALNSCGQSATQDATKPTYSASTASNRAETEKAASPSLPIAAAGSFDTPISCAVEIGEDAARRMAEQCRAVSPATRPPCNAANSCAMIRNEIARGCALLGDDAEDTRGCTGMDPIGKAAAADMVDRYYAAINARDFTAAWSLWGSDGGNSGQSLQAFTHGFVHTRRVHVDVGDVSDVEGAAGSLYVTVPVTIEAQLDDGRRQRFTGSYQLRQINRGMGPSQGWHIATAILRPA